MTREEIIKGLNCCIDTGGCEDCPYKDNDVATCAKTMKTDAIKLLEEYRDKEHEPTEPDIKYRTLNKPDILSEFLDFAKAESSWVSEMGGEKVGGIEYVIALAEIAGAAEFIDRLGADTWQADTTNLNTKLSA